MKTVRLACVLGFAALLAESSPLRADTMSRPGGIAMLPSLTPRPITPPAALVPPPAATRPGPPVMPVSNPAFRMPAGGPAGLPPGLQCRQAIRAAERGAGIPDQLMAAIGRMESGRADAAGVVHPWPWTINAEGVGAYFQTKAEAIAAVRALQARGVRSIDVGCMQVNLMYHPTAFASLEQGFDPQANAVYAARFLNQLFSQTGSWPKATAHYHSATPDLGDAYQRRVASVLPEELRRLRDMPGAGGNVWSNNALSANAWNSGGGARPVTASGTNAGGSGGFMLSAHADQARLIAAPVGAVGRGLDAYRAMPIALASRMALPSPALTMPAMPMRGLPVGGLAGTGRTPL